MSAFVPSFNHQKVEKKWQDIWYNSNSFSAKDFDGLPKYYNLVEFPYPSGAGMHVGHIRAYSSLEVVSRKRRMEGYNVLFPIGFDAFGLPTENYAIKNKIHPRVVTDQNIKVFTEQLKATGFSFDFSRVVDTTDPEYYRWTQWIFLKMYEKALVYKSKTFVNFCPDCKVVLSNEESQGGECDRCGAGVIQLEKDVWFLKITDYAGQLLKGLDEFESTSRIRTEQENWIGKSEGAYITFKLADQTDSLKVFTTRPDTIYGATFMVIAPEHPLLEKYHDVIQNNDEIHDYQALAKRKTEFERIQLNKDKTGVRILGLEAVNPLTHKNIPIFISDYVVITYGTGAIMAVPGHDDRDYDFAKKYQLDIIEVIKGGDISQAAYTDTDMGTLVNSGIINDLPVNEAKKVIVDYLVKHQLGVGTTQYKMKDWAFNRQRYWGEPIPIVYCDDCGVVAVPYEELPVKLPMVEHFEPTDTGESPLAKIESFTKCSCPKCGKPARRETDTMPQWAGSSWYFLRYMDSKNHETLADIDKMKYWGQVDWYNGGMEHVTRHLIYSRFWNQFLFDQGIVPNQEPYKKRTAQGLILGEDGEKMSKSRGNIVNPMDIITEYGADTLRVFILFIGDYEMATPWNEAGLKGARRFLDKLWRLQEKVVESSDYSESLRSILHKTIKGVGDDIEQMKFNTAISKLMIAVNEATSQTEITRKDLETLTVLTYPFAPHIAEEIFQLLGNEHSLVFYPWPVFDEKELIDKQVTVVVNVNGKIRDKMIVNIDMNQDELKEKALQLDKIQLLISDKKIVKIIVVPNKLVNIVIQ